ncbi:hypothetical protein HNY73_015561 [Argiope bruennichi]|uniref:Uncharacterized protein n=1 Tax=Argiope bruennichi TaxID=94029 RepID=A0A8T0ETX5_ARGBR|nr:hypothetical protein HNY73_015561 [Argiope bruennichi]
MLFGRELRLPCDLLFGRPPDVPSSPEEYVHELQERLESVHEFARNRIDIATEKMKTRYDTRATGHEFHEGDHHPPEITDIFILGLDFLTKHNFVIDFENNVLRSNSEDVALFQLGAVEREPCHRITCKSDITIPARIEMLVRGAAEKSQNFRHGLTEFPDSENFPKGVLVASALVDLSKETVPVRVVNLTGNPKTIRKGDVLATCAPVTCIQKHPEIMSKKPSKELELNLLKPTELNEEQKSVAWMLIDEYEELFSCTSGDLGRTKLAQHRIETGNHSPIKQNPTSDTNLLRISCDVLRNVYSEKKQEVSVVPSV